MFVLVLGLTCGFVVVVVNLRVGLIYMCFDSCVMVTFLLDWFVA